MSPFISWYLRVVVLNNSGYITVCDTAEHFQVRKSEGTNYLKVYNI